VFLHSGWDAKAGDAKAFLGQDGSKTLHFPGFSKEACEFLVREREVAGLAVDTLSLDIGASKDFAVHRLWLGAGKWGLECVANLSRLPPAGATVFVGAPKVVGASGGIGRAVALRLARDGFAVVVSYAGNAGKAEDVVRAIKSAGGQAIPAQANVADAADVQRLFQDSLGTFGRVDVVVNSAGVMPLGRIADGDVEAFDRVIATNLRGAFLVLGQAARHVAEGGRIIALSSSVLARSFPTYGPYVASKAGVEGLVRVLANELRGRNVTVNAVAPGPVATELFLEGKTEAQIKDFGKLSPLERLGQPEDVANVVSFLAGPDGGWVNGQVVRANGGFA
jgi:3-oxoacyl-[acyl-carrier protein] reductase